MRAVIAIALLVMSVVACSHGPASGTALKPTPPSTASLTPSPSASAAPTSRPSHGAATPVPIPKTYPPPYAGTVLAVFSASDGTHVLTTKNGVLTDHLMDLNGVLTAGHGLVVELVGTNGGQTWTVYTVDLSSGRRSSYGSLDALGVGTQGPVGALVSPDGSQLALGSAHKLLLISLASGSTRVLATDNQENWLMPMRWGPSAIIASEVGYEGAIVGDIAGVSLQTGAILPLGPGPIVVLSPDGRLVAISKNTNLGDGTGDRSPWFNTLTQGPLGGSETQIVQEASRDFLPMDITDSGEVLLTSDTSSFNPVAADMGLYVSSAGHVVQQLPLGFREEWGQGAFLNPSTALVVRIRGGSLATETAVDLDMVHLCPDATTTCKVTTSVLLSIPGKWPTEIGGFFVVGQLT